MTVLLLLASAALVLLGHLFRLLRWEQFIRIYERPARGNLLRGMAGGYTINFLLPFHVGDLFRALFCGRRMKSGTGFALATVIMDRFLDVWVVALCFGVFRFLGQGGARAAAVEAASLRYFVLALALAAALALVIALRVAQGLDVHSVDRLQLVGGAVTHEHRLALPFHLDGLARLDRREVDFDRRQRQHVR